MRRMYSEEQIRRFISSSSKEVNNAIVNNALVIDKKAVSVGDRTLVDNYNKVIINAGIMLLITNFELKNETESDIAGTNCTITFDIPEEFSDKIFCLDGEKLSATYTSYKKILAYEGQYGNNLQSGIRFDVFKSAKNQIKVQFTPGTMAANSSAYYDGRIFMAVI